MSERILVVEDDPTLQETLAYNLSRQGYLVDTAGDGQTAIESARANVPDLVVLDIMLPILDGFEVCRVLRQESNVSILMLTARDDEIDRVIGLELGADDYLTKPFSPRELVARIKAAIRRLQSNQVSPPTKQTWVFDRLRIDLAAHQIWVDDQLVDLTSVEFALLSTLARNSGMVLTRNKLLEEVWGVNYFGDTRLVDVHIGHLRKKLNLPELISTIRGVGYRFDQRRVQ